MIRWFTHSRYSHVSLLLPDGRHAEAREFRGVVVHDRFTPKGGEKVDFFALTETLTTAEMETLEFFIGETVGEGYDWRAIAGFVFGFRPEQPSQTRWFCSEWAGQALATAGRRLLRTNAWWTVCPHEIGLSPFLTPVSFNH